MALVALLLLLFSAFAGLAAGRRSVVAAAAIAVIPCAVVGGTESVAESSAPRAG